ncbi:hypothetical protein KOR34_10750 [Posidoniimonas corsicana]|uniref:Uncharacterized protein n=1 Tax=Posidoniimonas corsicana TaxID=1938618 RepID=A0A5C5VC28_9BACT|nr:right-handed parallel beta-helix repeat-containing protein [Posidoniimonas corsicana]TWT36174.1 hypothetical protein KOR34_10750 [Posidoniimonas corsicana]
MSPAVIALRPWFTAALITLSCGALVASATEPTFVELDGQLYGAQGDEVGPIGGGEGYTRTVTEGDRTATTLDELLATLQESKAGDVVFVPGDAQIDLTARIYIEKLVLKVPPGVTLASDRGADRDGKTSPGALFTSDALDTPVVIEPQGPGVRITGIRLRGPNTKRYLDHHARARELHGKDFREYYYKLPTSDGVVTKHDRLEVDNCEISGFAHAGVHLRAGVGHHVHHCSIHHCQYQGLGYGVCHDRASSLIERCLFDWNRHSIAGTGRPSCGYVARHNVELGESLSHCFDMHGGHDRGDGTNTAGTRIEIANNTFRSTRLPIKVRGVPEEACDVRHNWFVRHDSPSAAVSAEERTEVHDNAYGEPASLSANGG